MPVAIPFACGSWPPADQLARVAGVVLTASARGRTIEPAPAAELWVPSAARVAPLRGGLESPAVARIGLTMRNADCRRRVTFVVKRLQGEGLREAAVYRWLRSAACDHLAPLCFANEPAGDDGRWLFLETLVAVAPWPWRQFEHVSTVVEALADLHQSTSAVEFTAAVPDLQYEAKLRCAGASTLRTFVSASKIDARLRPYGPALSRVVESLPAMRRQMTAASGLPPAVLHGDVHTRNLALCRRGRDLRAVFTDWARARCGSPLEDVSSWLHSLGFWEPEARRRHDTLLKRYFERRGRVAAWSRAIREPYWLASASNALAGALEYHLWRMAHPRTPPRARESAAQAARDWLRIIRRADAVWRTTARARPDRQDANDRRTKGRLALPTTAATPLS